MKTLPTSVIDQEALLNHWQGHRRLTRRVIEVFPEEEFFNHSVGGMRTFAEMTVEILSIAVPGLRQIVTGKKEDHNESLNHGNKKSVILTRWDDATKAIDNYWKKITPERFHENVNLFGVYDYPVIQNIQYFIDNEIHHRGQGYVYLRTLGIEPPYFWER